MRRREFIGLLSGVAAFALPLPGSALKEARIYRIGFQSAASSSANAARTQAFRQALRELGYVEGQNLLIEWLYADGKIDRLPALAQQLVRLKVDVIVTAAPSSTRAAKQATSTIPIVMVYDTDPVANGFVASLARPGGNITGLSSFAPEITGKQLELLKEIVPKLSEVAVLGTSTLRNYEQVSRGMQPAAQTLGVHLRYLDILKPQDIEIGFRQAREDHADAVLVLSNPIMESYRAQVAGYAVRSGLPAIYHVPEFVEVGGLLSYGVSFIDLYRRAATYVDKILKGANPADLPVEQPTKFELAINLKTAKALGLTIPQSLLLRADQVIE